MNNNLPGEQIAQFRKAMGITQEDLGKAVGISAQAVSRWECGGAPDVTLLPAVADALGVTVDALFGREGGSKADMEDVLRRWIATIPKAQRINRLCQLIWAAASPAVADTLEDVADAALTGELERFCQGQSVENGKARRWLRRIRITSEEGVILGLRADDMSCVSIFPEPETGWEPFLDSNANYRRLFAVLARPRCLELLEYLNSKPHFGRRYTPEAVAGPLGMEGSEAEALMNALSEMELLNKAELETSDGVINCYMLCDAEALVPFLYSARWLITGGGGYLNCPMRKSPMLRGEKWKETEREEN